MPLLLDGKCWLGAGPRLQASGAGIHSQSPTSQDLSSPFCEYTGVTTRISRGCRFRRARERLVRP